MRTALLAALAALIVAAPSTATTPAKAPVVNYCDVLITKQGKRVFAASFGARLAPLAQQPRCASTYPLVLSGCYFSPAHLTWVQLVYTPWTGPYYRPC